MENFLQSYRDSGDLDIMAADPDNVLITIPPKPRPFLHFVLSPLVLYAPSVTHNM